MHVRALLDAAIRRLEASSDSPRADAELLLAHALGSSRAALRLRDDEVPSERVAAMFEALLLRRIAGEPIAYLLGTQGFWSLELEVTPAVLIPRPDTETLVEWAIEHIARDAAARVLDLGTGSGCIALAIASERPQAQVLATDRSPAALDVARANAARLGLSQRMTFRQGDWFDALDPVDRADAFDLIVSNPPYIARRDPHLDALRHEPLDALVAGDHGLDDIRRIVAGARARLRPGGALMIEHGFDQGAAVRELFATSGSLDAVRTRSDLGGRERVTAGWRR